MAANLNDILAQMAITKDVTGMQAKRGPLVQQSHAAQAQGGAANLADYAPESTGDGTLYDPQSLQGNAREQARARLAEIAHGGLGMEQRMWDRHMAEVNANQLPTNDYRGSKAATGIDTLDRAGPAVGLDAGMMQQGMGGPSQMGAPGGSIGEQMADYNKPKPDRMQELRSMGLSEEEAANIMASEGGSVGDQYVDILMNQYKDKRNEQW